MRRTPPEPKGKLDTVMVNGPEDENLDDHREAVADDVVHLSGHAGAFGGRRQPAALVALDLELDGAFP